MHGIYVKGTLYIFKIYQDARYTCEGNTIYIYLLMYQDARYLCEAKTTCM